MKPNEDLRVRKFHRRSRDGCLTCRKKHVRCDELRPICARCTKFELECMYPLPVPSLEELRQQVDKAPSVTLLELANGDPDPFDCLPIDMPFRSKDLLRYFIDARNSKAPTQQDIEAPDSIREDCVAIAVREHISLRSTLLVAAVHYVWQAGRLDAFEKSYFYHKTELIKVVNKWLVQEPSRIPVQILRLIAVLSLSESSLGNYIVGEAHLQGLLTILELRSSQPTDAKEPSPLFEDGDEVLERLIIVAHNYAAAVKSRLSDRVTADIDYNNFWQKAFSGLSGNLASLRILPYYFSMEVQPLRNEVDGHEIRSAVRSITKAVDKKHTNYRFDQVKKAEFATKRNICDNPNPTLCSGCMSLSSLVLAMAEAHASTIKYDPDAGKGPCPAISSAWRGLAAAVALYLNSVLQLWSYGKPTEPRMFFRLVGNVMADVSRTESDVVIVGTRSSLWFWKVFIGAHALMTRMEHDGRDLGKPLRWFYAQIRTYSLVQDVSKWEDARASLSDIAWPALGAQEDREAMARFVWKQALHKEEQP